MSRKCEDCGGTGKETSIGGAVSRCWTCKGSGKSRSDTGDVRRAPIKSPARMKHSDHQRLWRAVEGAVVDALKNHPSYLTDHGRRSAVESITKRVVGSIISLANEPSKGGRN